MRTWLRQAAALLLAAALLTLLAGCSSGGNDEPSPVEGTATPATPAATPLPPDPPAARQTFADFVKAVGDGDVEKAWSLYAASLPGATAEHRSDQGCDFGAFSVEFPKMQHFFARAAPFDVVQSFGNAAGSVTIELKLQGKDGSGYLATLVRVQPTEPYRLITLNSGRTSLVPGAPDPFPSPEDPQGFCGIWTGSR